MNGQGAGIAGASVEIVDPYRPSNGISDYVKTDKNGYFSKDGILPGKYLVSASKLEEGYGDTRFGEQGLFEIVVSSRPIIISEHKAAYQPTPAQYFAIHAARLCGGQLTVRALLDRWLKITYHLPLTCCC